jgi:hypothetical protein
VGGVEMSISKVQDLINIAVSGIVPTINLPAQADFNGDGFVDYVFSTTEIGSSTGQPLKIYESKPDGSYVDVSNLVLNNFTTLWTQKIIAVDLNNDGRMDLVLGAAPEQGNARSDGGNGSNTTNASLWGSPQYVLIQNADGTFTPAQTISTTFEAHCICVGDFNNDGFQDILYVSDVNNSTSQQFPRLMLNDGKGGFSQADLSAVIGVGSAAYNFSTFYAAVGDFNNDGNLDIVFLQGGQQNGAFDVVAFGDGKGGFTKGPQLPMIPQSMGGINATIEGAVVLDLNHDGKSDLLLWVVDRTNNSTLGDLCPSHLEVLINQGNGNFVDQTVQWLGAFATVSIGGDTRSLQGFIPGTNLISLNISVPVSGTSNAYLQEPLFLYDTGSSLVPIYDPYWNQEILNGNGFNFQSIQWTLQNGQLVSVYNDWKGNLVQAQLNPANELSYASAHSSFTTIDLGTHAIAINDGYAFDATFYQPYNYQAMPSYVQNETRMLVMNLPASRVLIGTGDSDFISVGNAYAATGNNILIGNGGVDSLVGGSGNDIFYPTSSGPSYIYGGGGTDTVVFQKAYSAYKLSINADKSISVDNGSGVDTLVGIANLRFADQTYSVSTGQLASNQDLSNVKFATSNQISLTLANATYIGNDLVDVLSIKASSSTFTISINTGASQITDQVGQFGTNNLININRIQFADTSIALDIAPTQNAGSVYMLYQAAFNRTPDASGLGYWINAVDKGSNITTVVAQSFINSGEFIAQYGANPTNASYVNNLYQNVLHRAGDASGVAYWNQELNSGAVTKAYVLEQFATLPEGAADVAPAIAHGIAYTQWVG